MEGRGEKGEMRGGIGEERGGEESGREEGSSSFAIGL